MSSKLVAATAAFVIAGVTLASAAVQTETGVIAKIDTKAPSITLKTGKVKTFSLDKGVDASALKVGEKVKVSYEMVNKKATASAVTAAD